MPFKVVERELLDTHQLYYEVVFEDDETEAQVWHAYANKECADSAAAKLEKQFYPEDDGA